MERNQENSTNKNIITELFDISYNYEIVFILEFVIYYLALSYVLGVNSILEKGVICFISACLCLSKNSIISYIEEYKALGKKYNELPKYIFSTYLGIIIMHFCIIFIFLFMNLGFILKLILLNHKF